MNAKINLEKEKEKLNQLAHEGSLKSIEKIEQIIKESKDDELSDYAQYALEEAQYLYYSPANEEEIKELILLKSIVEREDELLELNFLKDGYVFELTKLKVENEVENKLIERLQPEELAEDDGYEEWLLEQIEEIEDECEYWKEWIKEAEGMIKTEKYKTMPKEVVADIYLEGEGNLDEMDEEDDKDMDCICDECDEECECGDDECECC